ncbi:MAG: hypothetical protein LBG19_08575 [Prevotellaceae bacterium]|jgi:uncharacterized membrane protein|nr:hypothetical protein [Prevotellaceae bacterium]
MATALNILGIVLLLLTIVQDFRYRAIYWWLCPLLAVLLVVKGLLFTDDGNFLLMGWLVNIVVVTIQLAAVWLYALLRKKRTRRNFLRYFGLGDVLCLYTLCFLCQPYLFVALCCTCYVIALIAALTFPKKFSTIPLVGCLSVGWLVLTTYELVLNENLWSYVQFMLNAS